MATKWCTKLEVVQKRWSIISCDQAALWMAQSVHPSVCLSHLFDYVPIIVSSWNFQELLPMTEVTSMQEVKVRGQKSRSRSSTPNLAVSRTATPVWIHIWRWNDAQAWSCLKEVPYCFSRSSVKFQGHTAKKSSILTQIRRFRTLTQIRRFRTNSSLNSPMAMKWCTKLEMA